MHSFSQYFFNLTECMTNTFSTEHITYVKNGAWHNDKASIASIFSQNYLADGSPSIFADNNKLRAFINNEKKKKNVLNWCTQQQRQNDTKIASYSHAITSTVNFISTRFPKWKGNNFIESVPLFKPLTNWSIYYCDINSLSFHCFGYLKSSLFPWYINANCNDIELNRDTYYLFIVASWLCWQFWALARFHSIIMYINLVIMKKVMHNTIQQYFTV